MLLFENKFEDPSYCERVIIAAGGTVEKGHIRFPENYKPSREVKKAISYLVLDWDYTAQFANL